MLFRDRKQAGKRLASKLSFYKNDKEAIVIGLPRGGVVLGKELAEALNLPLEVTIPRKITLPSYPEFAIGAITETGEGFFNETFIQSYNLSRREIAGQVKKEKREAQRRLKMYRGNKPLPSLKNKKVILVDDGIATGFTMIAAIHSLKNSALQKIIVAVPVAPIEIKKKLEKEADEWVVLNFPSPFLSVGRFYEDCSQVTDEEVMHLIQLNHE